jgi:hypothetical protein
MRRLRTFGIFAATLVLLGQAMPLHAATQTWFGFQMGVNGGSVPPPPVAYRSEPHYVVIDDVRVVDDARCDDDVFMSNNMWWRLRGGYWYRSSTWHGPWIGIDVRRVPERVLVVPASHWKHHPHHDSRNVFVVHERDRHDNGRHEGHEHHGHGHGHHGDDD